jgi:hypothetical protein
MAAENAENAEYERVLREIVCDAIIDLCHQMNLGQIKQDLQFVSQKSEAQMEMLKRLKIKIESLNEGQTEMELLKEENAKYLESRMQEVINARNEVRTANSRAEDLERRLEEAINARSVESVANIEMNRELDSKNKEINYLTHTRDTANNEVIKMHREISALQVSYNALREIVEDMC